MKFFCRRFTLAALRVRAPARATRRAPRSRRKRRARRLARECRRVRAAHASCPAAAGGRSADAASMCCAGVPTRAPEAPPPDKTGHRLLYTVNHYSVYSLYINITTEFVSFQLTLSFTNFFQGSRFKTFFNREISHDTKYLTSVLNWFRRERLTS